MKEGIYFVHFGYLFFIYIEICKRDESKIKEYVLMRKGGLKPKYQTVVCNQL